MSVTLVRDPERSVHRKFVKQLTEARKTIKAVKDPSNSLLRLDKSIEKLIAPLKGVGDEGES